MLSTKRKLIHMVRFIEQEGHEKAEEIDSKTEEEFNILKGKSIQEERIKIMHEYDKKESQAASVEKTKLAFLAQANRLLESENKKKIILEIETEVRYHVDNEMKDKSKYNAILHLLLLEGLLKLMEKRVKIRCRKRDTCNLTQVVPNVKREFQEQTQISVQIEVDKDIYLDKNTLGGILICCQNDTIVLNNTLDSRIQQTVQKCQPAICEVFFGSSKFRSDTGTGGTKGRPGGGSEVATCRTPGPACYGYVPPETNKPGSRK